MDTENPLSTTRPGLAAILSDQWRILTFRRPGPSLAQAPQRYLVYGLLVTWLAGIGRYWDHPSAYVWQYAGLGSLAYVLVLASFLWLVLLPLRPLRWSWRNVLLFLTLTSLPALLYAIPVERFLTWRDAQQANLWFLATVATWRVALLVVFLRRVALFNWFEVVIGVLLPLALILLALTFFNLEHAVLLIMAGLREGEGTLADVSYTVVALVNMLSVMVSPVVLLGWLLRIWLIRRERRAGVFSRGLH